MVRKTVSTKCCQNVYRVRYGNDTVKGKNREFYCNVLYLKKKTVRQNEIGWSIK